MPDKIVILKRGPAVVHRTMADNRTVELKPSVFNTIRGWPVGVRKVTGDARDVLVLEVTGQVAGLMPDLLTALDGEGKWALVAWKEGDVSSDPDGAHRGRLLIDEDKK